MVGRRRLRCRRRRRAGHAHRFRRAAVAVALALARAAGNTPATSTLAGSKRGDCPQTRTGKRASHPARPANRPKTRPRSRPHRFHPPLAGLVGSALGRGNRFSPALAGGTLGQASPLLGRPGSGLWVAGRVVGSLRVIFRQSVLLPSFKLPSLHGRVPPAPGLLHFPFVALRIRPAALSNWSSNGCSGARERSSSSFMVRRWVSAVFCAAKARYACTPAETAEADPFMTALRSAGVITSPEQRGHLQRRRGVHPLAFDIAHSPLSLSLNPSPPAATRSRIAR